MEEKKEMAARLVAMRSTTFSRDSSDMGHIPSWPCCCRRSCTEEAASPPSADIDMLQAAAELEARESGEACTGSHTG